MDLLTRSLSYAAPAVKRRGCAAAPSLPRIASPTEVARMSARRRAFVTGIGCVGPHGTGRLAFESGLRAGLRGVRHIQLFDADALPCRVAAEVPEFDPDAYVLRRDRGRVARVVPLAIAAAREALADAGYEGAALDAGVRRSLHVLIGSGGAGVEYAERQYEILFRDGLDAMSPYAVPCSTPGMLASEVSLALGLGGMSHVLSNGCTSSTDALGYALDLVRAGRIERALVGGADACITRGVVAGYCAMRVVSTGWNEFPARASRPMSADRDGFVLGEGAWVLVIESDAVARRGGRRIWGEIAGYGATCEAHHRVALRDDGVEPARAMRMALEDAGVAAADIDVVHLHGTGTVLNDRVETRAVRQALGAHASRVAAPAIKSMIGHPQGASGAAGVVAALLGMHGDFVPPTVNRDAADDACDLDCVPHRARPASARTALCNCLGFGSKNAALIVRRVDDA
jgi:3-oxoacyl-[acyl-carrier-protein] synthase II